MIHVSARVDAHRASEGFKRARRDLNGRMRQALREAGEEEALPAARAHAAPYKVGGVPIASTLTVRSTARTAYITTTLRGKLARAVGLLEFGGTVRTEIRPTQAQALTVEGVLRARVSGPRNYPGIGFLREGVASRQRQIEQRIRDRILDAFLPEFDVS